MSIRINVEAIQSNTNRIRYSSSNKLTMLVRVRFYYDERTLATGEVPAMKKQVRRPVKKKKQAPSFATSFEVKETNCMHEIIAILERDTNINIEPKDVVIARDYTPYEVLYTFRTFKEQSIRDRDELRFTITGITAFRFAQHYRPRYA